MGGLLSKGRGDSGRLGDFYSTQVSTGGTKKTQQNMFYNHMFNKDKSRSSKGNQRCSIFQKNFV